MMATHSPDDSWFLDTGATHHLSNNSNNLSHTLPYQGTDQVTISNGKHLTISHVGSKTLHTHTKPFHLQTIFHVPHLTTNLISVSRFCSIITLCFDSIPISFLSRIKFPKRSFFKATLNVGYTSFPPTHLVQNSYVHTLCLHNKIPN